MMDSKQPQVLLVGAGAMGMVVGRNLGFSGASVTYLVSPSHVARLASPQRLYSYDLDEIQQWSGYEVETSTSALSESEYQVVVLTIDGASLKTDRGRKVVKAIANAKNRASINVVVGSITFGAREWILQETGLARHQVTEAVLTIHCYQTSATSLPVHPPTTPDLLRQADYGYADRLGAGIILSDSSLDAANTFLQLYNQSPNSRAQIMPAQDLSTWVDPIFAVFAGCSILKWPSFSAVQPDHPIWVLTTAAVREIQSLRAHGPSGKAAAGATSEQSLLTSLQQQQAAMLPLDLQAFNQYHHGGKVLVQDRAHLQACLEAGQAEGCSMEALQELMLCSAQATTEP